MGYVVRMPKLGLEMEEGTLLEWAVSVGESVSDGDLVAEIESEKSIGEVEAREAGVLRRTYLDAGDTVPPGTPIGIVAAADADIADLEAEAEADLEGDADGGTESASTDAGATTESADADSGATTETGAADATEVKASPRARKRAEELGVDLAAVEGTGPQGSITADDVAAAEAESEGDATEVKASPRARKRAEELGVDLTDVEGTGPQGSVTADDVTAAAETDSEAAESATTDPVEVTRESPTVTERYRRETAVLDADAADALLDATTAAREAVDEEASITDVTLLVTAAALAACPRCNGTYADATHQLHESRHIAIVGESGIDTVVANAGTQSLSDVVEARTGGRAADAPEPTFTLSNAAAFGDGPAGRVINPPAVAALEFDPTGQRGIPGPDGLQFERLVTLSLTYDTRALDGDDAGRFLDTVAECAERAPALVTESYLD